MGACWKGNAEVLTMTTPFKDAAKPNMKYHQPLYLYSFQWAGIP
jgi:hypothetical protein